MKQKQIHNLSIDTVSSASSLGADGDIVYIKEKRKVYVYVVDNTLSANGDNVLAANGTNAFWFCEPVSNATASSLPYIEDTLMCGGSISAGQVCYFKPSVGKLYLAIDNGTGKDRLLFIAKENGVLGDSIKVACAGNVNFLTGLTAGQDYALSKTSAGASVPFSSLITGDYAVRVFTALTPTKARLYDEEEIVQV